MDDVLGCQVEWDAGSPSLVSCKFAIMATPKRLLCIFAVGSNKYQTEWEHPQLNGICSPGHTYNHLGAEFYRRRVA
jgi:hypothetical protein